jgi:hypothetical protein
LPFFYFELGGHLGWKSGSPDTILEGGRPRIISAKFGCTVQKKQVISREKYLPIFLNIFIVTGNQMLITND